jgi:hypothetical protein
MRLIYVKELQKNLCTRIVEHIIKGGLVITYIVIGHTDDQTWYRVTESSTLDNDQDTSG